MKDTLLTALTSDGKSITDSIISGNSVVHSDMDKVLEAIRNVNGQSATANNAGNDPGATPPPAYTISNTLKDVPVSEMKLPTGGLAPAPTLTKKVEPSVSGASINVSK